MAAVGGIWDVLEVLLDTAVVKFLGIAGGEEGVKDGIGEALTGLEALGIGKGEEEVKDGVGEAELSWEAGSQQAAGNSFSLKLSLGDNWIFSFMIKPKIE